MAAITLPLIEDGKPFPSPETALREPDGLLAFGGDLSPNRLLEAYRKGIFPWFSDGEPILWWSPSTRAIISPQQFHISKSLNKTIRRQTFTVSVNTAFHEVINACAHTPRPTPDGSLSGTWITDDMIQAYIALHHAEYAHSIEVWDENNLVGGLYGVVTDRVFCGESMFHRSTNASKIAMTMLVKLLAPHKDTFIDCQMPTEHLSSLGAISVKRLDFLSQLRQSNQKALPKSVWTPRILELCLD